MTKCSAINRRGIIIVSVSRHPRLILPAHVWHALHARCCRAKGVSSQTDGRDRQTRRVDEPAPLAKPVSRRRWPRVKVQFECASHGRGAGRGAACGEPLPGTAAKRQPFELPAPFTRWLPRAATPPHAATPPRKRVKMTREMIWRKFGRVSLRTPQLISRRPCVSVYVCVSCVRVCVCFRAQARVS